MAENLVLDSLQVRGFRAFRDLQIPHLGRVNLIVGKNNVGKSSLLEALRLYTEPGSPVLMRELLVARQESKEPGVPNKRYVERNWRVDEDSLQSIKHIFYGRPELGDHIEPILIGPIDAIDEVLSISIEMRNGHNDDNQDKEIIVSPNYRLEMPRVIMRMGNHLGARYSLDLVFDPRVRRNSKDEGSIFIPANGVNILEIGSIWNQMASLSLEEDVLNAIKIIAPEAQRISLLVDEAGRGAHTPVIKLTGAGKPVPLRSMGEGMVRMFGLALALVSARNGMLLIDEVESGLHYSVQADMWRLIFGAAQRFNIQVFATTHSLDCIKGFRKAAIENKDIEGVLIRLQRKKDDITAVLFDEQEVAIATRNQIEVR